jgi:hypothetical protein
MNINKVKVQTWAGPEGSRRSKLPDFESIGGMGVSPTHLPPLSLRKYSWYSFLLETESTPGA